MAKQNRHLQTIKFLRTENKNVHRLYEDKDYDYNQLSHAYKILEKSKQELEVKYMDLEKVENRMYQEHEFRTQVLKSEIDELKNLVVKLAKKL